MNWSTFIMSHTGMNAEQYNSMVYDAGISFLDLMESDAPQFHQSMQRNRVFWTWWSEQFNKLCQEWIDMRGITSIRDSGKSHNLKHFTDFLGLNRVPTHGLTSYSYLIDEVIRQ